MYLQPTRQYITTAVAGEAAQVAGTADQTLQEAKATLGEQNLAGEMIPSLNWFIHAFIRKEACYFPSTSALFAGHRGIIMLNYHDLKENRTLPRQEVSFEY